MGVLGSTQDQTPEHLSLTLSLSLWINTDTPALSGVARGGAAINLGEIAPETKITLKRRGVPCRLTPRMTALIPLLLRHPLQV